VVAKRSEVSPSTTPPEDETIPVELGGVTRFIQRSQILYASAHGDYARMHTANGSHLVRVSLNALEERWGEKGFVRIHRSTLVSLAHVTEVSSDSGRAVVRVGDVELQVSRRHTRDLRERLLRPAVR
jgi:DNA-binding LytR/AlgR family response regulator